MRHSLEATIAALLAVATPLTVEAKCDDDKIAFLANSYIVSLNDMLKSRNRYTRKLVQGWGLVKGNVVLDDGKPYTSDRGGKACKKAMNCDPYSFIGQTVWDMEKNLDRFIRELKKEKISRVIVYEGVNSIAPGRTDYKSNEKKMRYVQTINGKKVQVYLAEMPLGLVGTMPNLNWHNINMYNSDIIHNVGADGVLKIGNQPWEPGKLHGYTPETLAYILAVTHKQFNPTCGYAKFQPEEYQRRLYERIYRKTHPQSGKRRR
ncbi:hypothetical protein KY363_03910 [Candidatus Woesearchaeota archaeon]|nr:hypothetical protein [Candidatus Woesearchaeota archaeon]